MEDKIKKLTLGVRFSFMVSDIATVYWITLCRSLYKCSCSASLIFPHNPPFPFHSMASKFSQTRRGFFSASCLCVHNSLCVPSTCQVTIDII